GPLEQPGKYDHVARDPLQSQDARAIGLQVVEVGNNGHVEPRLHEERRDNILLQVALGGMLALALRDDDRDAFCHDSKLVLRCSSQPEAPGGRSLYLTCRTKRVSSSLALRVGVIRSSAP